MDQKSENTGEKAKIGSNCIIRPMHAEEKKEVRKLCRRCFPITEWWPFRITPNVLVAEFNDNIVGAVVLRLSSLSKKRKVGFVEYIFTAPEVRGRGYGQKLVEASLKLLEEEGCKEIVTQIKGDNTSSSKSFSTRGFTVLSPGQQLRRYGVGIIKFWITTMHVLAKGQLLWVRTEIEKPDKPAVQWWGNLIANILVIMLIGLIPDTGYQFNIIKFFGLSLICTGLFGMRQISMMLMARKNGLTFRYRPVEDWFAMSVIFALSGVWIPIPGNIYSKNDTWSYRKVIHKLGPVAFTGAIVILLFSWITFMISITLNIPTEWAIWIDYMINMGAILSLLDIVFTFFPLEHYNGRRIWNWSKIAWAILAMLAIILFVILLFF